MQDLKLSKSLSRATQKGNKKFVNDIYFKPIRRKQLRQSFVEARDSMLKELSNPLDSNSNYQEAKNKYWADVFSDQMTDMINLIDDTVPKKLKEIELIDTSYKLFKKQNGKAVLIECNYYKGVPKKYYVSCLLMPSGFPSKGRRTKAQIIRKKYNLKDFVLIDKGTFTQKFVSFQKVIQVYKGKMGTLRFELSQRGKIKDDNWLKLK